ncbi:uncharacterized protein TNCT_355731 [Trichonephila clavata]|uniref:Uncharacterized protein n=1 Tax=Trichonephila clavata TaxID=2740835 RepID=A0A8X6H0U2_TRICU|nr:uncharacterized protein TNCT_355731 [Trichonephila clavata]
MEQMKTKRFALLLACILCITVVFLLYGDPSVQPSIQSIVTETHSRISNWKGSQAGKEATKEPDPEEKYLKHLGFNVDEPRLYPASQWSNTTLPVFVTALSPSDSHFIHGFLKSFQHFFVNSLLVIYDLGINPSEYSLISNLCNSSNCILRTFDFDAYPSHIRNLQLSAYRPIIIQEVLNQAGAVIMLDVQYIFTSGELHNIVSRAEKDGIVAWSINQPTSALTHPRMFDYFNTKQERFFFHRMVQPNHIVLYNIDIVHFKIMFHWVKCALVPNCIAPIGAQNSGCRFDKKPLYRYSGCHRYDMSALNVVLGLMFDFSSSHYSAKEEDKFFRFVDMEKDFIVDPDKNSTIFPDFN